MLNGWLRWHKAGGVRKHRRGLQTGFNSQTTVAAGIVSGVAKILLITRHHFA